MRSALLVVDVQQGCSSPTPVSSGREAKRGRRLGACTARSPAGWSMLQHDGVAGDVLGHGVRLDEDPSGITLRTSSIEEAIAGHLPGTDAAAA